MSFINLQLIGQTRPELHLQLRLPPYQKPERESEQENPDYFRQAKTTQMLRNIQQVYYLERRLFL